MLVLDPSVRSFREGTVLVGGTPGRVITLTPAGVRALAGLLRVDGEKREAREDSEREERRKEEGGREKSRDEREESRSGREEGEERARDLGRRLVDAGMAHPRPRPVRSGAEQLSVTVVVPAHDRPDLLGRCLTSLGSEIPVVVVDDASRRPDRVAAVCRHHGAQVVRREVNGGPAAARNTALDRIDTDLVAFVDSDCTVGPRWLDGLVWQFADPVLAAVAPRIRPEPTEGSGQPSALARFTDRHSALDLGPAEGEVGPTRAVRYVPTAALVARRCALAGGFDEGLRVGEDVDLVWRLLDAGWHVRYAPSVTVGHLEPASWSGALARRVRYGTSAAPLARRHPGRLAPVELRAWPTAAAVSLLAGRPRLAALIVAGSALSLARTVRPLGIPASRALRWSAEGTGWTVIGLGHASTMLAAPALVALATQRRGARSASVLALLPAVVDWVRRRPDLDLPRWVAASLADDMAYGAGVWFGCLRSESFGPLVPALTRTRRGRAQSAAE